MQGAELIREVFARVRNKDAAVADLYAEDAIILYGDHGRARGRDEIRAFYQRTFQAMAPQPQVEAVMEAPPRYVAIVDVPTATQHHRALDLFEVDDRGIIRLEIFARR